MPTWEFVDEIQNFIPAAKKETKKSIGLTRRLARIHVQFQAERTEQVTEDGSNDPQSDGDTWATITPSNREKY
jgi:hypothetical protein